MPLEKLSEEYIQRLKALVHKISQSAGDIFEENSPASNKNPGVIFERIPIRTGELSAGTHKRVSWEIYW